MPTPTPSPSLADVVEKAKAGVVRIAGSTGAGSGFVIDPAGHILTNAHVVEGQDEVTVIFDDGAELTPQVVASDLGRDIALLKVEAEEPLAAIPLTTEMREGDDVIALGYPLHLRGGITVTTGIVSAFRTFGGVAYIQTDAAINPGNSGGPLLNLSGEVVGINTSVLRTIPGRSFDAHGIGFAIRANALAFSSLIMWAGASAAPTPTLPPPEPPDTFGPESGIIGGDAESRFVSTFESRTAAADFVAEAAFTTPNDLPGNAWGSGFLIRRTERNSFHALVMHGSGVWRHYLRNGGSEDYELLKAAQSSNIRTGAGAQNHVRVVATGSMGWLFINGGYEARLELSGLEESGSVALIGAVFKSGELTGRSTRFTGFTVRPFREVYGPIDGGIEHDPGDGLIDVRHTLTRLADGMIEARFYNPYPASEGDWTSGFLIRRSVWGEFHAVGVDQSGRWFHRLRSGYDESERRLGGRDSAHLLATGPSGSNHLRVIALGGEGSLFINGVYVGSLDLSGWTGTGNVDAVGGYFRGDGIEGMSTRFEGLTIWSADGSP